MSDLSAYPEPSRLFLMTDSFDIGGSERQFAVLATSLDKSNFRTEIGCISNRGRFSEELQDVTEFPLGGSLYSAQSLQTRWRLLRHFRDTKTQIAHAFDFYTNVLLIPIAKLARVPVVIGSQRQIGDLLSPSKARAQRAAFQLCDKVICNSQAAASALVNRGLAESKPCVIRNGLPRSAFLPAAPAISRIPGVLRVGMIARMNTWSKNHRTFLRAAERLNRRMPDVEFVLVGDGPLRSQFEREAVELGIGNRTLFLADRKDIVEVLASLDVTVLPSSSESLSNSIIESMAAGVPVIASNVGGNPELLRDDQGVLLPPKDEEALAGAMERLLRNPDLRYRLSENAKTFAQHNFTIEEMCHRHEELYAELIRVKLARGSRGTGRFEKGKQVEGKALRVVIVGPSLRYVGGQSVQANLLLDNWKNDSEVEARFLPIDPAFPASLKWAEHIPFLRTIIREPIYLWTLRRAIKDADVVHIFSASYSSFLIAPMPACILAQAMAKKTLIHYHSGEARDHLHRSGLARQVLKRAQRLVVPSEFLVDVFREFGLQSIAVPNIVDLSRFVFRARRPLRPHFICTRGFHHYYRVDLVIQAFAEIQKQFPDARLDLVGGGPQEREIRNLVSSLRLNAVTFLGVASREQIGGLYNAADIFINASSLDNMPVSILEAFFSGTPVVSTAPEGIHYLVEHETTGLLSPPGDANALARNAIRLLQDRILSSRIASNALKQSDRYRWSPVRAQWLEVYEKLSPPIGSATNVAKAS
jgi:L-malate glycosyltransferase